MHISYIIHGFFRSIWHLIIEVLPFVCLCFLGKPPQSPVSLRRLLAAVSVGRDASALFPDVVGHASAVGACLVVATRGLYRG